LCRARDKACAWGRRGLCMVQSVRRLQLRGWRCTLELHWVLHSTCSKTCTRARTYTHEHKRARTHPHPNMRTQPNKCAHVHTQMHTHTHHTHTSHTHTLTLCRAPSAPRPCRCMVASLPGASQRTRKPRTAAGAPHLGRAAGLVGAQEPAPQPWRPTQACERGNVCAFLRACALVWTCVHAYVCARVHPLMRVNVGVRV